MALLDSIPYIGAVAFRKKMSGSGSGPPPRRQTDLYRGGVRRKTAEERAKERQRRERKKLRERYALLRFRAVTAFANTYNIRATQVVAHGMVNPKAGEIVVPEGWQVILCARQGNVAYSTCVRDIMGDIMDKFIEHGHDSRVLDPTNWHDFDNDTEDEDEVGPRLTLPDNYTVIKGGQKCPNVLLQVESDACRNMDSLGGVFDELFLTDRLKQCQKLNKRRDEDIIAFLRSGMSDDLRVEDYGILNDDRGSNRQSLFWNKRQGGQQNFISFASILRVLMEMNAAHRGPAWHYGRRFPRTVILIACLREKNCGRIAGSSQNSLQLADPFWKGRLPDGKLRMPPFWVRE
jgi:hypothetical protein